MVTTPTPPDAVREARNAMLGVLLTASSQSVSRLAVAIGLSFDAFESDIVDALLTRPSDARGREVTEYAIEHHEGSGRIARRSTDIRLLPDPIPSGWRTVQRTVTTTDWTPLSPTQEGANNG